MFSALSLPPDGDARAGSPTAEARLRPALGVVRGSDGAEVVVELYTNTGGAGFWLSAPAIHHTAFEPGDTVLLLFTADDPDSAVVLGRVGNLADLHTAAGLLAQLLEVDGAGSALDADLLDGEHESALLRADGSRPLLANWDVGAAAAILLATLRARAAAGLRIEDAAGALGLRVAAGGNVGIRQATPSEALDVTGNGRLSGTLTTGGSLSVCDGVAAQESGLSVGNARTASGFAYLDLVGDTTYADYGTRLLRENSGANARTLFLHRGTGEFHMRSIENAALVLGTQSVERLRVRNAGVSICGPGAGFDPQGVLHTFDGLGGRLITSKSAIGTTAQTLLADGAGDVTQLVHVDALVSTSSARTFATFTLDLAGTTTHAVALGSESFQFRLNAGGSLDVRRTAGTLAGAVVVQAMWL